MDDKRYLTLICILLAAYANEVFSLCDRINSPSFRKRVEDTSVKSGQNASFTCVVSNFNSDTDQLTWQIGPDLHRKRITERYYSDIEELSSTFTALTVPPTNFYLSCAVDYVPRLDEGGLHHSSRTCRIVSRATLTVEYFTDVTDLKCSPNYPLERHPGDVVPVRCGVPRCEPAVNLVWRFNDTSRGRLPRPVLNDIGLTRVLSYDLVVQKTHHLSSIMCVVTSRVSFPSQKLECRIGPLSVFQAPSVKVQPQHTNATEGASFQLNCLTHSYPEVTSFLWSCSPEGVLTGCNSTSQIMHMVVVKDITLNDTSVIVICAATNSEGTNTSNATVSVLKHIEQEGIVTGKAKQVYTIELSISNDMDTNCVTLACSVSPNTTNDSSHFDWIIDGLSINSQFIIKQAGQHGNASFVVLDKKELKVTSRVTCRVNVSGSILERSSNVSISTPDSTAQSLNNQLCKLYKTHVSTETVLTNYDHSANLYNDITVESRSYAGEFELFDNGTTKEKRNSRFHFSTRNFIILITGGIVGFIALILCSVALVFALISKLFRKRTNGNSSVTGLPGNIASSHEVESDEWGSSNDHSVYDSVSIYETPITPGVSSHVPLALPNPEGPVPTEHEHTYFTADTIGIQLSPSWGSSSAVSWDSSSDYSPGDNVFPEHEYADSINMAVYGNQSVVDVQRMFIRGGRSLLPPGQRRHDSINDCMNVPIPSLPKPTIPSSSLVANGSRH